MSTATTTKMTAEEFYDWVHRPENVNKWFELVRGEVIELPAPTKSPHGVICVNVGFFLSLYARKHGSGYVTSNDSGVILERDPDTVRGPDVALYDDAERFVDLHPKYGEHPPVLAVEVLSPNDRADRVIEKINDYLRTRVRLVWVVNPSVRSVTVYQPDQPPIRLDEMQELTGGSILPEFRCRVLDFFLLPGEGPRPKAEPV
jgi:Uma2 family endonuclease